MRRYPQELTDKYFVTRLAAFYGALGIAVGAQMPFLPVWLAAKGLDAQTIGLTLAVPMIVRVFAIPMATRFADRRDALRGVIATTAALAVAGYAALGFAGGTLLILAVFAFASAAQAPAFILCDAYALRGFAARPRAYGPVRIAASVGFIAASLAGGVLLDAIEPVHLIWLVFATVVLGAVTACALAPLNRGADYSETPVPPIGLLRSRPFLFVVAASSLVQASHAVYYGFGTLDWRAAGYDGEVVGGLWALGVLSEIVLFALSARLPMVIGPTVLLSAGACGAVIRWTAMAFDPPAAMLPLLQGLHAFSFGATHLGATTFVARNAPPRLGATAQGYLGVALGVTMAAAMGLSGVLYGRYGGLAYGAMAIAALAGVLCALAAHRASRAIGG